MATPNWLNATEMAAWRNFVETTQDLLTAIDADLAVAGLTLGDYQVLVFLSEAPDNTLRMGDLAAMLQLTPSGLTRRLDGLVGRGLVARRPSATDRRVMLAKLTTAGSERLERAAPVHVASVRARMIDLLDESQQRGIASGFEAIRAGLGRQPVTLPQSAS